MFVVLLRFSDNKSRAGKLMNEHNAWIKKGFDDDVFLLVGSLQPNAGGSVVAYNISLDELQQRVNEDPFVRQQVVRAEIMEISPAKVDERLTFLMET